MKILPAIVALAASLPAVAFPCSPIENGSFRLDSHPDDDGVAFPHDAAPLIRIGDLREQEFVPDFRAGLLDAAGAEVPSTVETTDRADGFRGSATWMRVFPDEILAADATFTLKLLATDGLQETQDDLDAQFPPVVFRTGRSFIEDEPVAPEFTIDLLDHAATPPVITPCGGGGSDAYQETRVQNVTTAAEAGPFDTWRFFDASDDLGDDLAATDHRVAVDARIASEDRFLVSWTDEPGADEACVIAVTEDAYGRTSVASEPVCAEAVAACAADCSAAGDRTTGGSAALLLLGILGFRRLRR